MRQSRYGVIALCLTFPTSSYCASPAALSWSDCVKIAAQNNPTLRASLLAQQSSRAAYLESYNGILPQISLTNSYRESETAGVNSGGSWSAQMSASLNLLDTAQWATIQSAMASFEQTQANHRLATTTTLLDLYKSFAGVLYAQNAIDVNEVIRDTWKMNAQMVQLRYQSGRESKGNMMNTDAQRLQADANLEQAHRSLSTAQTQLRQSLGEGGYTVTAVTGTWSGSEISGGAPAFDSLVAGLPAVKVQEASVEIARARTRSAQSTLWPALGLNYAKGAQGPTEFPKTPFWSFTGTLSIPIFGNGPTSTYYSTLAAQRSLQQAEEQLRAVRLQARYDLESAWAALLQAQDQVRVQRAFLEAAKQRKAESDVRYQSGLMSFEDWIRVVSDYASFQISYLRAQQTRLLAEAQWRYAQGESI